MQESVVETYRVHGVAVTKCAAVEPKTDQPPIIMTHGGVHGPWAMENWARYFAGAGYEVHVPAWYNHGTSDQLPEDVFVGRSIVDIAHNEIKFVASGLDRKPILIGHSMGGLASAVYAEGAPVERLILLTPVMPAVVHPDPVPLPTDPTAPFPVFPVEQAGQLFFAALSDDEVRRCHALLVPESPVAVVEATQWTVDIDIAAIKVPVLVFATEFDVLTPADAVQRYAEILGAPYIYVPGIGHSSILLKAPEWQHAAEQARIWLSEPATAAQAPEAAMNR